MRNSYVARSSRTIESGVGVAKICPQQRFQGDTAGEWQKRGKEWEIKQERQENLGDNSYKANCTSHFPLGITEDYQPGSGDDHRATRDFRESGGDFHSPPGISQRLIQPSLIAILTLLDLNLVARKASSDRGSNL